MVKINRSLFETKAQNLRSWFSSIVLKHKEKVKLIFGRSSTLLKVGTHEGTYLRCNRDKIASSPLKGTFIRDIHVLKSCDRFTLLNGSSV